MNDAIPMFSLDEGGGRPWNKSYCDQKPGVSATQSFVQTAVACPFDKRFANTAVSLHYVRGLCTRHDRDQRARSLILSDRSPLPSENASAFEDATRPTIDGVFFRLSSVRPLPVPVIRRPTSVV